MAATASSSKKRKYSTIEELNDGDFRFTTRSRRQRLMEKGKNDGKSAKKKRRSSFVRGSRQKHSLIPTKITPPRTNQCEELHKQIPQEWLPTDRLHKLLQLSHDLMIGKIKETMNSNNPDIAMQVADIVENLKGSISKSDCIKQACTPPSTEKKSKPNPKNKEIEVILASTKSTIERLKQESEEWERLLLQHQTETEKACSETNSHPELFHEDLLTEEHKEFLNKKLDVQIMRQSLQKGWQEIIYNIDNIFNKVNNFKKSVDAVKEFVDQQYEVFGKRSLEEFNSETPRYMLRRIISN